MAKKGRRRKPSLLTKAINIGVVLLALAFPIRALMGAGDLQTKAEFITSRLTGNLNRGGPFNLNVALELYGPMVGAIILKKAISMVRKSARV